MTTPEQLEKALLDAQEQIDACNSDTYPRHFAKRWHEGINIDTANALYDAAKEHLEILKKGGDVSHGTNEDDKAVPIPNYIVPQPCPEQQSVPSRGEIEPCDHEWKFIDASFDHEFGTEQVHYDECQKCGETKPCQGKEWYDYE